MPTIAVSALNSYMWSWRIQFDDYITHDIAFIGSSSSTGVAYMSRYNFHSRAMQLVHLKRLDCDATSS